MKLNDKDINAVAVARIQRTYWRPKLKWFGLWALIYLLVLLLLRITNSSDMLSVAICLCLIAGILIPVLICLRRASKLQKTLAKDLKQSLISEGATYEPE